MANPSVRFEIEDTVVLRGIGLEDDLFGRVERTYNALDSHEPLEDCLIIAYFPIDTDIYRQFIESGRPPKGYLFVEFGREEDGHALLPEDNVELISRAFSIGDTVKQHTNTSMFGTVVDVQSRYLVESVFRPASLLQDLPLASLHEQAPCLSPSNYTPPISQTSNPISRPLRYDISGDDLRRAEDFEGGDHIFSHDWFGLVELPDIDVAILLDNQTVVWVEKPWELEIVVGNPRNKPFVSMPELDGIRRPDVLNVNRNGLGSITARRLGWGDEVVTNRRNLEKGRWLVGKYDPDALCHGVVLDVRTRRMEINWLVPNAFVTHSEAVPPSSMIRPYENLSSFRDARELRASKDLVRYDHHRKPFPHDGTTSTMRPISSSDVYHSGDRVRIRSSHRSQQGGNSNVSGFDAEHGQGKVTPTNPDKNDSGRPELVPRAETFQFDLNVYRVIRTHHKAVVLWQDGTESTLISTELTPYSLPETDLCPGDLVMAKEGLKMTTLDAEGEVVTLDFNEMSFFEKDHVLQPAKVGVIQSVDGQERLARVRWYANPQIRLIQFGQVLENASFGKIGKEIEGVSLYEIMKAPVLVRKLGDFVLVPPGAPTEPLRPWQSIPGSSTGPTSLSFLAQMNRGYSVAEKICIIAELFAPEIHFGPPGTSRYDWLGEIIRFGLDGTVTVRMGGMKDCQDVIISHENILLIVDDDMFSGGGEAMDVDEIDEEGHPAWDEDSFYSHSDVESAIDEVVEYEGGERLDEGSGADDWSTDDDTPDEDTPESFVDAKKTHDETEPRDSAMSGTEIGGGEQEVVPIGRRRRSSILTNVGTPGIAERNSTTSTAQNPLPNTASKSLAQFLPQTHSPASFEVLERLPPLDQYRREQIPASNPAFLKRITKEHRILSSSLPASEIYVRTYESRLDLLRCLIIGPADTPYEFCPFLIDIYLGPNFPKEPPSAHFHSWTSGLGRINPNLYEEGKICLSLLGTWPGQDKTEGWSEKATILQLLVSLQGLVFVSKPFYNEAGFETYGEEKVYTLESQQYTEKAYVMARGFVKYALLKAPEGVEDVLAWLYLFNSEEGHESQQSPRLLAKVIDRANRLMDSSVQWKSLAMLAPMDAQPSFLVDGVGENFDATKTFIKPLSEGAAVMLRKMLVVLEETRRRYEVVQGEEQEPVTRR